MSCFPRFNCLFRSKTQKSIEPLPSASKSKVKQMAQKFEQVNNKKNDVPPQTTKPISRESVMALRNDLEGKIKFGVFNPSDPHFIRPSYASKEKSVEQIVGEFSNPLEKIPSKKADEIGLDRILQQTEQNTLTVNQETTLQVKWRRTKKHQEVKFDDE